MTGDGSQQINHGRQMTINLLPMYKEIEIVRNDTILQITLISSYNVTIQAPMHLYHILVAWLHIVRYEAQFRAPLTALIKSIYRDPDSASVILSHGATMPILYVLKSYTIGLWWKTDL